MHPTRARSDLAPLIQALFDLGAVRFGEFTLHSGLKSPIYLDLRLLISDPKVLRQTASAYTGLIREAGLAFDRLAAIPYAALPIGVMVAQELDRPLIYPRKEIKEYGTRRTIEGRFAPGETVLVLDDLVTTGASKFEAIAPLTAAGLVVHDVVVLIDREQGGRAELAAHGYRLHSLVTMTAMLNHLVEQGCISADQRAAVLETVKGS